MCIFSWRGGSTCSDWWKYWSCPQAVPKQEMTRRWGDSVSALRCLPHYPCPVYGASDLLWNSNPYNVKVVQDLNLIKSNPPSWSARNNMSSLWLNLPLSWGMKSWLASVWVEQEVPPISAGGVGTQDVHEVLIWVAKRGREVVNVLSSKLIVAGEPPRWSGGALLRWAYTPCMGRSPPDRRQLFGWYSLPPWPQHPLATRPEIPQDRTGSDNQKSSPSNILPSSQINQEQLSIELMKVSAVFLTTLLQYVVTLRLAADLHLLQPL